jgi:hypothetical protein
MADEHCQPEPICILQACWCLIRPKTTKPAAASQYTHLTHRKDCNASVDACFDMLSYCKRKYPVFNNHHQATVYCHVLEGETYTAHDALEDSAALSNILEHDLPTHSEFTAFPFRHIFFYLIEYNSAKKEKLKFWKNLTYGYNKCISLKKTGEAATSSLTIQHILLALKKCWWSNVHPRTKRLPRQRHCQGYQRQEKCKKKLADGHICSITKLRAEVDSSITKPDRGCKPPHKVR